MMNNIKQAKDLLNYADAVLITAGAGMGVDSELPDFRGNTGFWKAYPYAKKMGLSFREMANADWFVRQPRIAWAFYGHRLALYRATEPHYGFNLLLDYCVTNEKDYFVYTSNVDGQFQKAGFSEDYILECHGSIHALQCTGPCSRRIWTADQTIVDVDFDAFEVVGELPRCRCGAVVRPNILMFNEGEFIGVNLFKKKKKFEKWINNLQSERKNIAIIELGAGTTIPSVRLESEKWASRFNACFIRINPREAHGPVKCISIETGALEGISSILPI